MNTFLLREELCILISIFTNKDAEALKLNNLPKVTNWYVINPGSKPTQV